MRASWLLLAACSLAGCRGFSADAPEGFAEYERGFGHWFETRAVSPDGVTFRVRTEDNQPAADLKFWREALKKRMLDAGYKLVSESDVKAGDEPGYLLELAAPVGQQDYSYAVALLVRGSHLVIAEAAGEVTRFDKRRKAIAEAIGKVR